jgi:hypothetical protein
MKFTLFILVVSVMAGGCAQNNISTATVSTSNSQSKAALINTRPESSDIAEFEADPFPSTTYFKNFKVGRKDLEDILLTWYQVSQEHWQHGYSHVAFGDRTGTIKLKDGTSIRWMVRPGGLASFTFQDGTALYLAKELTPWGE